MSDEKETERNGMSGMILTGKSRSKMKVIIITGFVVITVGILYLWPRISAQSKPQHGNAGRGTPVAAVPARKGDIPIYIDGIGSVVPLSTVTVRTRIDGQLMAVLFKEGQMVRKGELLAQIDPRPFQVQLEQAEGQMDHDRALLKNARLDLDRYQVLWKEDSIPKQQLDTQEALVGQYEAAIKADQAAIDNARLQLTYCKITSPTDGRIGLRLVDPGNMVRAADTNGLIVINQLQPITVVFPIPEDNLPIVVGQIRKGSRLPVEAYNREQTKKLAEGHLLTLDNQVDPTTGTVRLKAEFDNKDDRLFPNQFVNARLLVDVRKNVIIAPSTAMQRGPQGSFVYIVKPDLTAEVRPVSVELIQGDEALVSSGLAEGERVVVDGAERLRQGAKVELRGRGNNGGSRSR
jgi:membrane fusion protein, multidrug efflux system